MHLIVAYLTPMFLATAGGDVPYARMAAIQAVKAYTAVGHVDLLYIAQIVAFNLAILDSLNRSMADNLSINQVLRLRGNAASLSRATERCHRALRENAPEDAGMYYAPPDFDPEAQRLDEEAVLADIANAEQRLAEVTGIAPARDWPIKPSRRPAPKARNPMQEMLQAARSAQRLAPDLTLPPSGRTR